MKKTIRNLFGVAMFVVASLQVRAQSMIYDQQTTNAPTVSGDYFNIQPDSPLLQSFVPALSAIGFVQFQFWDIPNNGTNGATVYVNLWTGSPNTNSAVFLSSTTPVYMPNGFGSSIAGVTNFYFSSAIGLTAGQTYYLQPVVLSGDNPFDIKVLGNVAPFGDYYPNGDLFEKGTDTGIDLWFGEGVVSVPEPSVLALVSLISILVYIFKRRFKLIILLLFAAPILSVQAQDSVVQATADEAGLTRVSATTLSRDGTFWVMTISSDGTLAEAPYPFLPSILSNLPIYSVSKNRFIVDDTDGQIMPQSTSRISSAQAMSAAQSQATSMADLIDLMESNDGSSQSFQANFIPLVHGSNDLWLSLDKVSQGISYLTIHVPSSIDINSTNFNLFYTTNVATPTSNWWWMLTTDIGQTNLVVPNATDNQGFYGLGYTNATGRPQANGDNLNVTCPNTTINFALTPSTYPSYTILTHPTNGVLSGTAPYLYYTPNPCFEGGQDSFTYKANDGTNDSAPATVAITIETDPVSANEDSVQTCRGASNNFNLSGSDYCSEQLAWQLVSSPQHGSLNISNSLLLPDGTTNITYTATGTNFTGTDTFNYAVYDECGDAATNTVTVTVGDANLYPNPQSVMTGTNRQVAVTLGTSDYYDNCTADTNYDAYTITGSLTNGYLTGMPPNLTYTPTNGEGMDSFQFTVSDGVWSPGSPATVTLYDVAGPILTAGSATCYRFGAAVQLDWNLDTAVSNMVQQDGLTISGYAVYRSTNSGGPYTLIYTNADSSQMSYEDDTAVSGQTNYYVVTFESPNSTGPTNYESPDSNKAATLGYPNDLIPANAVWDVATNLSNPTNVVKMQAPFSSTYPKQYQTLYPLPNTNWPINTTWTNHIAFYIPTNVGLSQVKYSIAIDNDYWLYLNNSTNYIDSTNRDGYAVWSQLQSFPTNLLHWGTNDIVVGIKDVGDVDYFSMVVTTNTCGW